MNTEELKDYKKKCLKQIEKARKAGFTIVKSLCPNCHNTLDSILARKNTWNNGKFDMITKGCYECGTPHFLQMNDRKTEAFEIDNENIIHIYKQ